MTTNCPAFTGWVPGRALHKPRRLPGRLSPLRPSSRPSRQGVSSRPKEWCSCLKVTRNLKAHALAFWRVTVHRCHRGVCSHFINEHQPPGVDLGGNHHSPAGPQELVSLCGASPPFLRVEPIRAMARHMLERLTETPLRASTYSQRSFRVTNGRSL